MLPNDTRRKVENIVTGALIEGAEDHCTAISFVDAIKQIERLKRTSKVSQSQKKSRRSL